MTSKPQIKTTTEYMKDFVPTYKPVFPLFLGAMAKKYVDEVGTATIIRYEALGDYRAAQVTPKDTHIKQIGVGEGSKTFKKIFLMNQFKLSGLQNQDSTSEVIKQVLDEANKQFDEALFLGGGTSSATVLNNGLFWSADTNAITRTLSDLSGSSTKAADLFELVLSQYNLATQVAGRVIVVPYGDVKTYFNKILSGAITVKSALATSNVSVVDFPDALIPASSHGFLLINMDQIALHYSSVPRLDGSGINEEGKYFWANFLQGNCLVDVKAYGGLIKQLVRLA
jgi:hypothetical protein